jgi:F0F1-type ATP synthase delta subunit
MISGVVARRYAKAIFDLAGEQGQVEAVGQELLRLRSILRPIAEALSRVTGKQVTVRLEIDPSLIGGLSARVGGLVFDGSIRAQLDALGEELKRVS